MNTTIFKRSYYLLLALVQLSWFMAQNLYSVIETTLIDGQKVVWAYKRKIDTEEVDGAVVNDGMTGETYIIPLEDKKPRKVNNYHLRYQHSARGV